jgi:hypothetical protein
MSSIDVILGVCGIAFVVATMLAVRGPSLRTLAIPAFWAYLAVFAFFAIVIAFRWDPRHGWELVLDRAGWAITWCAVVRGVVGIFRLQHRDEASRSRTHRATVLLRWPALLLVLGYTIRTTPRAVLSGWWAALPATAEVELAQWLPENAISTQSGPNSDWSLESRLSRNDLWGWQQARLRVRLRKRFIANPTQITLADYRMIDPAGADAQYLSAAPLEEAIHRFFASEGPERKKAALDMWEYLPTHGKTSRGVVGAIHGRRLLHTHVQQLIDLIHCDDESAKDDALDLLAVCGDEATPAIPAMVDFAQSHLLSSRYWVTTSLSYLATNSPAVQAQLIEMTNSKSAFERLLAVESLAQSGDPSRGIVDCLTTIVHGSDPVMAAFANQFPWRWKGPEPVHVSPEDAVFVYLNSKSPDRADYLLSIEGVSNANMPMLVRVMFDDDPKLRAAACKTLRSLKWDRESEFKSDAQERLAELLDDPNPEVRHQAVALKAEIRRQESSARKP